MPQQSITEQIDRLDAHADMLAYINADIDLLFDRPYARREMDAQV
jgi:hypothetical protein